MLPSFARLERNDDDDDWKEILNNIFYFTFGLELGFCNAYLPIQLK